ncbi:MAG TPA: MFS transporter [Candidatus Didemnitutus sp.]|jgi:MFS family permease
MYSIDWDKVFARRSNGPSESERTGWRALVPAVSRTVWALGVTSMLTDISSEMVASILPMYLVIELGMTPFAFGFIDGIYQGAAALVRVIGGALGDRWNRHKEVAAAGYGLSAACRILLLLAGGAVNAIGGVVALDRIGKGIRTAPRDAMITQSTPKAALATAFGVHRGMDAAGAMLGPLVAFALLAGLPNAFDVVFVASFGAAILGVAAIVLFVPALGDKSGPARRPPGFFPSASGLLRDPGFRRLLVAGVLLSLATISDSFLFLALQKRSALGTAAFPLLYVATSLVTSLFAVPCGRLADRIGRTPVLIAGYAILAGLYVALWATGLGGWLLLAGVVGLLGLYYAATDGVLTAMVAAGLPRESTGSGLAIFATATNVARLLASIAFGYLWMEEGNRPAILIYLSALAVVLIAVGPVLMRKEHGSQTAAAQ